MNLQSFILINEVKESLDFYYRFFKWLEITGK